MAREMTEAEFNKEIEGSFKTSNAGNIPIYFDGFWAKLIDSCNPKEDIIDIDYQEVTVKELGEK